MSFNRFELLQAGLAGMKLLAGVMSDGDGSSGLAQPIGGNLDGLKMQVGAREGDFRGAGDRSGFGAREGGGGCGVGERGATRDRSSGG